MQYWTSLSLIIISECDHHPQGRGGLHSEAGLPGDPVGVWGQCDALEEGTQGAHCGQHQGQTFLVPTHCFFIIADRPTEHSSCSSLIGLQLKESNLFG